MTVQQQLDHALEALSEIYTHVEAQMRPNGTSKMLARVAEAGFTGGSIEDAKQRPPREDS